jgi:hypothetical protein
MQKVISDLTPGMRIGIIYNLRIFGRDLVFTLHTPSGNTCTHRRCGVTACGLINGKWGEIESAPSGYSVLGRSHSSKWRYLLCDKLRKFTHPIPPWSRARAKTFKDHLCCGPHRKLLPKSHAFAASTIGGHPRHPARLSLLT